jgi:aminopeptidase N
LLFASVLAPHTRARAENIAIECQKSLSFLAPIDSPDYRKYAPDREVDVIHLALDVTPDFTNRMVEGKAVWTFKPIARPADEIRLDAVELNIHDVTSSEKIAAWQNTGEKLIVTFASPIPAGREANVTITWNAQPNQGLYFRTPEMGYKPGDTHLFSQGEEIEARHWYPSFDFPNIKFTSEVTCRLPAGMTAVSNGRLVSEETDSASGLVVSHWSQEKPHSNYLISLVAGFLRKLEDKYKDIPIAFYTPASEINLASNSFVDTKDMLSFFEQETGVPYPWAKYYQVCVNDFVEGGMENTSCTTLTDDTLFTPATENIRSSEGLVAHELAHQWFGDLVTCKDWSHIWLNESFATYYETLYRGHKQGRDDMLYELYGRTRQITGITNNFKAIVRRNFDSSHEMFDYLAYPKGGWVLHMLRSQLGDDLFRRCIKTHLERHLYSNAVTDDLRAVIEELSGRSWDQFFDQWLYHGYHPELEVSYAWDERTKLAKLTIRQVQRITEDVALFNLPLIVRFNGKFGTSDQTCRLKGKEEDFYFPLESAPQLVRLDPEYTVLAKVNFKLPAPMLYQQLAQKDDVIGRLLAIEQLGNKDSNEAVSKLKQALNHDAFYGVRIESARALRTINTDEALKALLDSTNQPDARAREAVVMNINGFYRDSAFASARRTVETEKNPDIAALALRGLAGSNQSDARETLLKYLHVDSYRNELAGAAISGMRLQDDPAFIAPLLETVTNRADAFTSRGLAQALETLAYLARNEEKKDAVRNLLLQNLNNKKERVQIAAIGALGTLGDPQAIPAIERFASASAETRQRATAERAVETLRAGRKPTDDFKNLRSEVMALQKSNRDLRKELDELKKQVDTKQNAPLPKAKPNRNLQPPKNR